jgi:hypothetical protein
MAHAAVAEQLAAAREHALRGEYSTAAVYYEGVGAAVTKCVPEDVALWRAAALACAFAADTPRARHVRGLSDPALKKQWLRLRAVVEEELDAVAALEAECAALRGCPDAQPRMHCEAQSRAAPDVPITVVRHPPVCATAHPPRVAAASCTFEPTRVCLSRSSLAGCA